LLLALVGLAVARSAWGTRLDSFTVDEPYHVVAGVSYLRTGDFRLNPEHPPLVKLWVAAWMPESFRLPPFVPLADKPAERDLTEETVFLDNDARAVQARARLALWSFHGVLLLALGLLLWRACGLAWAAGTLAFLALEPTVGAHLPVVMTDLPLALTLAIAAVAGGLAVSTWSWRWIAGFGMAMGLALAAKHSAIAGIAGIVVVTAIVALASARRDGWRRTAGRLARLAAACALAWLVLWACYGLRFHAGRDGSDAFNRPMADKVADLNLASWRGVIGFADRWHLAPRAYLWGLADTVRAGVEGRGQISHLVLGRKYLGRAPLHFWPAVVVTKVPLALLAMALLGAALLARAALPPPARLVLWSVLGMAGMHLLALMRSAGTYAGVRHALPIVLALAVLAGAAVSVPLTRLRLSAAIAPRRAWQLAVAPPLLLLLLAAGMTLREPRLWEYHNELAGGTAGAYRQFSNEGLDLGQRYHELLALYRTQIAPTGEPFYSIYWFPKEEADADRLQRRDLIADIHDRNVRGEWNGFFLLGMSDTLPWPEYEWDPRDFAGLQRVARIGHLLVLHGRVESPRLHASMMFWRVLDDLYGTDKPELSTIAQRLDEIVPALPKISAPALELGNLRLRLGDRAAAERAYEIALARMTADDVSRPTLVAQLASLRSGVTLAELRPVRSAWLE